MFTLQLPPWFNNLVLARTIFLAATLLPKPLHAQLAPVTGTVVDGSGSPVPEAVVTLGTAASPSQHQTLTRQDGSFAFESVGDGRYTLRVQRQTFAEHVQEVSVPQNTPWRVELSPAVLNQSIVVTAQAGFVVTESSAATKVATPNLEIPQDIQVVNRALIDQRLDFQLADAARTVSGVSRTNTGSGYLGNSFALRGFTLDGAGNYLRDGLKFGTLSFSDLADVAEVQIMKGPASVLYGSSEPGGVISLVSRRAQDDTGGSLQFTGANGDFYRPEFDVTGPLLRKYRLDYRVIGSYQHDFQFRDYVKGSHYLFSPSLFWHPTGTTAISVFAEGINGKATSDFGVPIVGTRPAPVPIGNYYGEAPWSLAEAFPRYFNYSFHHGFSSKWSLENRFAFWSAGSNYLEAYPTGVQAGKLVQRLLDAYRFPEHSRYSQTEVIGRFDTGFIHHTVLIGFEAGWRDSWFLGPNATAPPLDVYHPIHGSVTRDQAFAALFNPNSPGYANYDNVTRIQNQSGYLQDQINWGRRLNILIGGRFDHYPQQYHDFLSGTLYKSSDLAATPRVGLVYRVTARSSLYASYVRSFNPASASSRSASGTFFKPSRAWQYETGWKQEALNGRLAATIALFWIRKTNVLTADPANPVFSVATGAVRSKGVDVDIVGRIAGGWNVWLAYEFAQAQIVADNTYNIGNLLLNAPRHTGNLWTTYEISHGRLQGLGMGGGIYASTFKQGNLPNSFIIPGYARVDATVFYAFRATEHTDWKFSLNIRNAFDKAYFEAGRGSFARPGAPFAAYSSVKFSWHL
jgi:iron complex outermembrane receptor protein